MKYFGVLTQFCICLWACTSLFLISCCNSLPQRPSPHMGRIFSAVFSQLCYLCLQLPLWVSWSLYVCFSHQGLKSALGAEQNQPTALRVLDHCVSDLTVLLWYGAGEGVGRKTLFSNSWLVDDIGELLLPCIPPKDQAEVHGSCFPAHSFSKMCLPWSKVLMQCTRPRNISSTLSEGIDSIISWGISYCTF